MEPTSNLGVDAVAIDPGEYDKESRRLKRSQSSKLGARANMVDLNISVFAQNVK